jgi:hypothetical protein
MNIRYHVELSEAERCELTALVGSGKHYARKIKRAQILHCSRRGYGRACHVLASSRHICYVAAARPMRAGEIELVDLNNAERLTVQARSNYHTSSDDLAAVGSTVECARKLRHAN